MIATLAGFTVVFLSMVLFANWIYASDQRARATYWRLRNQETERELQLLLSEIDDLQAVLSNRNAAILDLVSQVEDAAE